MMMVHTRVWGSFKSPFQLFELVSRKRCSCFLLFGFLWRCSTSRLSISICGCTWATIILFRCRALIFSFFISRCPLWRWVGFPWYWHIFKIKKSWRSFSCLEWKGFVMILCNLIISNLKIYFYSNIFNVFSVFLNWCTWRQTTKPWSIKPKLTTTKLFAFILTQKSVVCL